MNPTTVQCELLQIACTAVHEHNLEQSPGIPSRKGSIHIKRCDGRPVLRIVWVLVFLIYAIVAATASTATISVAAHVGGLVCGMFPAFLFLPRLSHEKWEAALPILGAVFTVVIYITLPTYFYKHVLPHLTCQ